MINSDEHEILSEILGAAIAETRSLNAEISGCRLCRGSTGGLSGAGHPLAEFFLLKGSPTGPEIESGVAFRGEIGSLLRKTFERFALDLTVVYGTNAIKCPSEQVSSEPKACLSFLRQELEIVKPQLILAMGAQALKALAALANGAGKLPSKRGELGHFFMDTGRDTKALLTFNPEKVLRDQQLLTEFEEDFSVLANHLKES